jgi:hypothetical protein
MHVAGGFGKKMALYQLLRKILIVLLRIYTIWFMILAVSIVLILSSDPKLSKLMNDGHPKSA